MLCREFALCCAYFAHVVCVGFDLVAFALPSVGVAEFVGGCLGGVWVWFFGAFVA